VTGKGGFKAHPKRGGHTQPQPAPRPTHPLLRLLLVHAVRRAAARLARIQGVPACCASWKSTAWPLQRCLLWPARSRVCRCVRLLLLGASSLRWLLGGRPGPGLQPCCCRPARCNPTPILQPTHCQQDIPTQHGHSTETHSPRHPPSTWHTPRGTLDEGTAQEELSPTLTTTDLLEALLRTPAALPRLIDLFASAILILRVRLEGLAEILQRGWKDGDFGLAGRFCAVRWSPRTPKTCESKIFPNWTWLVFPRLE
jgi:hypothetical protein